MYIKSVVLDGFKSYGHRTEVTGFDEQFNAITGLNGSGKSNILDSICFVLGITNLTHVRANSLQDLIYKSGQCGINKATVSITFDNRNPEQCPPGFENIAEITITRQIVMGGKNKYMINGSTVPNKKVQDLFCSVQLNVNNPHFLIMQGKITKVLNMKPHDILAMIEEAAGTKMYEVKKQMAQKTIEKKDAKLSELKTVLDEELTPRLEKLKAERSKYMEFKNLEREEEHMVRLYQAFEYFALQRKMRLAQKALENEENALKETQTNLENHKNQIRTMEDEINVTMMKADNEGKEALNKAEAELKDAEKEQSKFNASVKSLKENIDSEARKKNQLKKNLSDDEKALKQKQNDLSKVEKTFQTLKQTDEVDNKALTAAEKRYEALCAGMEINEEGEAETLLEQLMNARQQATKADTEAKQAEMRIDFCKSQLAEKQKQRTSNAGEISDDQKKLEEATKTAKSLEDSMKKTHFKEERMTELQNRKRQLMQDMRRSKDKVDDFEARRPYTQFRYRDPEPNFNRNKVFGVVARLIEVKDDVANVAIEMAAGGRLYNVVIDSDVTGKMLLQKGDLQRRTTFIPLNKIQANRMSDKIVAYAESLVGKENVQPAVAHLNYDRRLQGVMDFIFGNIFICKNLDVAKQVAFHNRIMRKCVTLEGDVVDPAGTLTGGAPQKGGSVLAQLSEIQACEAEIAEKERELERIEAELGPLSAKQEQYVQLKRQLEIKQHEIQMIGQRLQHSSHYRRREEIANLRAEIDELEEKIVARRADEKRFADRVRELEGRVKNSKGGKEEQIKEAEGEMKRLKAKADKSRNEWKQREQDYETFNLEIEELKKSIENTLEQMKACEETGRNLQEKLEEKQAESKEINGKVAALLAEVKREKATIAEKNKDLQRKIRKKEELESQINDFEVRIKEHDNRVKKLKEEYKSAKTKQKDSEKRVKEGGSVSQEAEQMTDEKGNELAKKIRKTQERKNALARTINSKAQTVFDQQEKEYNELKKKQRIVEHDKKKLINFIGDLDKKKQEILSKAYEQISKDFGSIFSTLLPGAFAKLLPPVGQTILQGLEVKVSLGGVWKESLTELSGGQRSLAALSLILAMLLFKPAPLYILDEVDAALDLSHTQNIGSMLKTHFKKSQFIIVSLKDGMFSNANVLFRTQFIDGVSTVQRTVNKNA